MYLPSLGLVSKNQLSTNQNLSNTRTNLRMYHSAGHVSPCKVWICEICLHVYDFIQHSVTSLRHSHDECRVLASLSLHPIAKAPTTQSHKRIQNLKTKQVVSFISLRQLIYVFFVCLLFDFLYLFNGNCQWTGLCNYQTYILCTDFYPKQRHRFCPKSKIFTKTIKTKLYIIFNIRLLCSFSIMWQITF